MLKNGKLYGSIIPPDVNSLRVRDVSLGEKIELQLIALTEHPVGKSDRKSMDGDKDSGIGGSSHPEDRITGESTFSHFFSILFYFPHDFTLYFTHLYFDINEIWCILMQLLQRSLYQLSDLIHHYLACVYTGTNNTFKIYT